MSDDKARVAAFAAAEFAARASYGRLLARVAARSGDVAAAEDALADAFASALTTWPVRGVPTAPEAWILSVARRKRVDVARHLSIARRPDVLATVESGIDVAHRDIAREPDERVGLMLVCAHPAIEAAVRPALILQTALGVEAAVMAPLFLLSPSALTKRLVRAKAKIRAAGLTFERPDDSEMAVRLHDLAEAIYGAYTLGQESGIVEGDTGDELRREAVYLAEVVAQALPHHGEALGLLALVRFCEARRAARTSEDGSFVPMLEQDPALWDVKAMKEGYELLAEAAARADRGPFQLEGAIHGAHCYRARSGEVPWNEIAHLYATLVHEFPSVGAAVGLAVATAHARGNPAVGLAMLEAMDLDRVRGHQPWWSALGYLHRRAGNFREAHRCLSRALGLTAHPRLQAYFRGQLAALAEGDVAARAPACGTS